MAEQYLVNLDNIAQEVGVAPGDGDDFLVEINGQQHKACLRRAGSSALYILNIGQQSYPVIAQEDQGQLRLTIGHRLYVAEVTPKSGTRVARLRPAAATSPASGRRHGAAPAVSGLIAAPIAGLIVRVYVSPGDQVEAGTVLLILEAMKMQNEIRAPHATTVKEVSVTEGQRVEHGARLVLLE